MTDDIFELLEGTVECIEIPITVTKDGAAYDPTGDVIEFAFCPAAYIDDPPADLVWYAGFWDTVAGVHYGLILVGSAVTLTHGTYEVFWRVTDNPEIPKKSGGLLRVR